MVIQFFDFEWVAEEANLCSPQGKRNMPLGLPLHLKVISVLKDLSPSGIVLKFRTLYNNHVGAVISLCLV